MISEAPIGLANELAMTSLQAAQVELQVEIRRASETPHKRWLRSAAPGFSCQTFVHQDFQQRLIANPFALSDLASLAEIVCGQTVGNLHALLLIQFCDQLRFRLQARPSIVPR
jgi:hypothetical protein